MGKNLLIVRPKVKKRKVKSRGDVKWTLLHEFTNDKIDTLFKLYENNKVDAKIFYHLNKGGLSRSRTVLFEYPNGDFSFILFRKTFSISKTSKMYSSENKLESITYCKDTGFYYIDNNGKRPMIQHLSYSTLNNFCEKFRVYSMDGTNNSTNTVGKAILDYFNSRFGWLRNISEGEFYNISLNTIVKHKLFNERLILRYLYKCPYPQAKFIHRIKGGMYYRVWREMSKSLINIENLSYEFFTNGLFEDSCRFANMLDEKVNCSWSFKRLKVEHDKWNKVITRVLIENEPLRNLNIANIFEEFSRFSGFKILRTNIDLLEEGSRMRHCVGTYSSSVDSGYCCIYRVDGYTLELRHMSFNNQLMIGQYMDFGNVPAPSESLSKVTEAVSNFNDRNVDLCDVLGIENEFSNSF